MALRAIIFRRIVLHVAEHTVQCLSVVRRHMGIAGLHVFRFFCHRVRIMALSALINPWRCNFLLRAVAGRAGNAFGNVPLGTRGG